MIYLFDNYIDYVKHLKRFIRATSFLRVFSFSLTIMVGLQFGYEDIVQINVRIDTSLNFTISMLVRARTLLLQFRWSNVIDQVLCRVVKGDFYTKFTNDN